MIGPRLLAVDLDGTLLDVNGRPHAHDVRALKAALARGISVSIITGRLYSGTRGVAELVGIRGAVGCADGSHIVDASAHATLLHLGVRGAEAGLLRDILARAALTTFVFAEDAIGHDPAGAPYVEYVTTWSKDLRPATDVFEHALWGSADGVTGVIGLGPLDSNRRGRREHREPTLVRSGRRALPDTTSGARRRLGRHRPRGGRDQRNGAALDRGARASATRGHGVHRRLDQRRVHVRARRAFICDGSGTRRSEGQGDRRAGRNGRRWWRGGLGRQASLRYHGRFAVAPGNVGVMKYPSPLRVPPGVQMGLRVQIVLALAGLMLLAFVPLFFAVASLTRATMLGAREHAALALGHAIAVQVADARARGGATEIERALDVCARSGDIEAACAFGADGSRIACVGSPAAAGAIPSPLGLGESAEIVRGATGRALEIATHAGGLSVVTHLRAEGAANDGSRLVRLVALYMATFALALLVFAYFVLTRLIVRPVEQLVDAADRVANGARTLRVPRSGARELIDLGASVQAMAERLIREEAALILKVEELTQTTTRLTQAQRQLVRSERMASVGQLAAGLAHEIGNPITALMGMQDLLLDGQLSQEAQRDFLQRMRRETERIHAVVRGLLDFRRGPRGDIPSARGPARQASSQWSRTWSASWPHTSPFARCRLRRISTPRSRSRCRPLG